MAEKYFNKFPLIPYGNTVAVDITKRAGILNTVYENPTLYYPYEIEPGERPDNISDRYYKDQYMSWILYLTNKVIDPYYDWYMDQDTFNAFITKKYGTIEKAQTKISYYRNNWYLEQDILDVSTFESLSQLVKKYYQPVYMDEFKSAEPYGYKRKQEDWKLKTNSIVLYSCNNASNSYITDELVTVTFNPSNRGYGQVLASNSSSVSLQHVTGVTTTGTITANSYLFGRESKANTAFTTANTIVSNIGVAEEVYWSPVSYYDYETELNDATRTIQVLNNQFSTKIALELKKLMRQ
jgi:hypothetical protein